MCWYRFSAYRDPSGVVNHLGLYSSIANFSLEYPRPSNTMSDRSKVTAQLSVAHLIEIILNSDVVPLLESR